MGLDRLDLPDDPIEAFLEWFGHARDAGQVEPEAMALATVGPGGDPSVRMVLLRGADERGFVFYTNRHSRKGHDLAGTHRAAAVFRWKLVDRQVRVAGPVEEIDDGESDEYFASRARGSQLAAWASDQSEPAADRDALDRRWADAERRYAGSDVPRPPWWGGYRIRPEEIEFWQEGRFRMHDRFRYRRGPNGQAASEGSGEAWQVERLYP